MTSTRGRGRKLSAQTKLREAREVIAYLEAENNELERVLLNVRDELRAEETSRKNIEEHLREVQAAAQRGAERRAEVLTDALVSMRVLFDPFA